MIRILPHQQQALERMRNGCILQGPTGSGKTLTALLYYTDASPLERLIVITTAKKRDSGDWMAEARFLGQFPEVDSWHNLAKYKDVEGAFFIFDEQRVVGSGLWVQSFLKITKKNSWILLSATPGDTWLDYIPVFVANGFYSSRTDFLREHVVFRPFVKYPKVDRYLGEMRLRRHLRDILVEMPYMTENIRTEHHVYCEYDWRKYEDAWKRRWNTEKGRPIRQVPELFSVIRKIINSDPSRIARVRELLERHPRVIVFYNFDYELEILRGLEVPLGEWNGHKHEPIPGTDRWAYLVQYAAGSEAWGCTETDTIIFYSLNYSYRMFEQAKGRIDRLDRRDKNLAYYVLRSSAGVERGIWDTLEKKQNFNERTWMKNEAYK